MLQKRLTLGAPSKRHAWRNVSILRETCCRFGHFSKGARNLTLMIEIQAQCFQFAATFPLCSDFVYHHSQHEQSTDWSHLYRWFDLYAICWYMLYISEELNSRADGWLHQKWTFQTFHKMTVWENRVKFTQKFTKYGNNQLQLLPARWRWIWPTFVHWSCFTHKILEGCLYNSAIGHVKIAVIELPIMTAL